MRVDMSRVNVMLSGEHQKLRHKPARWPCVGGVGSNSVQCTS